MRIKIIATVAVLAFLLPGTLGFAQTAGRCTSVARAMPPRCADGLLQLAGQSPNYQHDEQHNARGPNTCTTDNDCDGARKCSRNGYCDGVARPPESEPMRTVLLCNYNVQGQFLEAVAVRGRDRPQTNTVFKYSPPQGPIGYWYAIADTADPNRCPRNVPKQ